MSTNANGNKTMPLIIGGLCVVLAVLVWQVIPRSEGAYQAASIPTTLEAGIERDAFGGGGFGETHGIHRFGQGDPYKDSALGFPEFRVGAELR